MIFKDITSIMSLEKLSQGSRDVVASSMIQAFVIYETKTIDPGESAGYCHIVVSLCRRIVRDWGL